MIISKTSSSDLTGGFRSDTSEDLHECENLRQGTFAKLEGLEGTIASLVVLDTKDVERAATSNAVWHLMNRNLTRPFVVGLMLVDIVLHITLMLVSPFNFVCRRKRYSSSSYFRLLALRLCEPVSDSKAQEMHLQPLERPSLLR